MRKDLKRLSNQLASRILDHLENDFVNHIDKCPLLQGRYLGLRKYRVDDHRIIFTVLENEIFILRIQHRREVYRD